MRPFERIALLIQMTLIILISLFLLIMVRKHDQRIEVLEHHIESLEQRMQKLEKVSP